MKKMVAIVMLVALALLATGCNNLPEGVQSSMYTAEITARVTVEEAVEAKPGTLWHVDPADTLDRQLAKREAQVVYLIKLLGQIEKNLATVSEYFRQSNVVFAWRDPMKVEEK